MKRVYDLANVILIFLTGLFVYRAYPLVPERSPMHFNLAGEPDRWGGRGGLIMLFVMPLVMTIVLYVLVRFVPRIGTRARYVNIPHKEEFLRLPAEKRDIFWALYKEFFAGLAAGLNLFFYLIVRGTMRIATGQMDLLPFRMLLPALALLGLGTMWYVWRMLTLPGKLVRGEI
jgi:uncharacterized membrane protein